MFFAPNMMKAQKLKTVSCKTNTKGDNKIQTKPPKYHFAPRDDDVWAGHLTTTDLYTHTHATRHAQLPSTKVNVDYKS